MSGREKWMPSDEQIDQLSDNICKSFYLGLPSAALNIALHRTGVLAQIAALEELIPAVCLDCAAGAPDDGSFNHYEGVQVAEEEWEPQQFECRASVLREKLEDLRKEPA